MEKIKYSHFFFRQLLQYMYTGSLGEAAKGREAELLAAADKYSLLELKKQCEKVEMQIYKCR